MEKEDVAEKLQQLDSLTLEELKKLSSDLKSESAMTHSDYDDGRLHLENLVNVDGLILPEKVGDKVSAVTHSDYDDGRLHLENSANVDGLILPEVVGDKVELETQGETDVNHKTR